MNKSLFVIILMILLSPCSQLGAQTEADYFLRGKDWSQQMSEREKFMSLIPPSLLFSQYDIHLKLSLPKYIFLIDKIMQRNPNLENEDLSSIFASTVYLFEPENRIAIRNMESTYLRGNYDAPLTNRPRLTISEILKEAS